MLTVKAPAKINLTLEVLGKRPDGYHEIRSVIQAIDLCDTLNLKESEGITFTCDMPGWSVEESLLSRTISLLKKDTGSKRGVNIDIRKRIPLMAGFGGDSSDAAALLLGLNELWKLGLSIESLGELAAQLGSDIVFFLRGGTALAGGRGEKITTLPGFKKAWVVLVVPDVPRKAGKTAQMYAALKPGHYTDGGITNKLVESLHKTGRFDASLQFNVFENIAFDKNNGLKVYQGHLEKLGAGQVHVAGSGPTLFTMFRDKSRAEEFYQRCKGQQLEVYLAETL